MRTVVFSINSYERVFVFKFHGDSEGVVGGKGRHEVRPIGKSQVVIGFLKTLVRTPPLGSKWTLDPFASRGRSVRPFVKYVGD